jgi:hypothetical protein
MTESEIMQAFLASGQVVISLFSMFFAMISAYIAGLYFFLNRAPIALRLLAFSLLSVGLVFLGAAAAIQQWLQQSLSVAWAKVPAPIFPIGSLRNPLSLMLPYDWSLTEIGTILGWVTATSVYLALGYMTFVYRWRAA